MRAQNGIPCDMPNQIGKALARNVQDARGYFLVSFEPFYIDSIYGRGKAGNPFKSSQQDLESGRPGPEKLCIFVGHVDRSTLGPGVKGGKEERSGSHPSH